MTTRETTRRLFSGGGGSGRDPEAHRATLAAARELLLDVGYARLTIEAVAARARVGKPTIYRWWRNKAELVHEAIGLQTPPSEPDTGELHHDLGQWIERVVEHIGCQEVLAALPGLLAERGTAEFVHEFSRPGLAHLRAILERARESGEIESDLSTHSLARMVADIVIGAVMSRGLGITATRTGHRFHRPSFAAELTAIALHGVGAPVSAGDAP